MNQDKIQYILIGILMAGMFAIGIGVYVMGQQIGMISDSIKTIEQGMMEAKSAPPVVVAPTPVVTNPATSSDTKTFAYQGLEFSYPKSWSASEDTQGGFWSFTEGGKQVAGLACPNENSPGPDPLLVEEKRSHSYVQNGVTLNAVLFYLHFRTDDFWMTGIDFGHPNRCDLSLGKRTAPTAEERSILESILMSVK